MQYLELKLGDNIVSIYNSWMGEEEVKLNGQLVSKISSILGANHHFDIFENGNKKSCNLTTKISNSSGLVVVDLIVDGEKIYENVTLPYSSKKTSDADNYKETGLKLLNSFDIDAALIEFKKANKLSPNDPEIYFLLACIYSNKEDADQGFECLKKSLQKGLADHQTILKHDMLAYLRVHPRFEEIEAEIDKITSRSL
jgi:tetratricopeptide (TPR) repeat protein